MTTTLPPLLQEVRIKSLLAVTTVFVDDMLVMIEEKRGDYSNESLENLVYAMTLLNLHGANYRVDHIEEIINQQV